MEEALQRVKDLALQSGEDGRAAALDALRQVVLEIETPHDTLQRLTGVHLQLAIVRAAVDLKLFHVLAEKNGPLTVEEIASSVNAAKGLTARLLRYLAAIGMVDELDIDTFGASERTVAFTNRAYEGGVCHHFEAFARTVQEVPAFLKESKYQDPTDNTKTARNKAFNTDLSGFAWLSTRPQNLAWFHDYMPIHRGDLPDYLSVFPFEPECAGWNGDVLLVDVGGGFGHQSLTFRKRYPQLGGRVIVQDLEDVIAQAATEPLVEKMAHDFFKPQPIKGAKFYYLRNVLHDWPDAKCISILRNILVAMDEQSCILIDEMVLPDKGVSLPSAELDLTMMAAFSSVERTKHQWRVLLEHAGLCIRDIYRYTAVLQDSIIVAVPMNVSWEKD